MKITEVCITLRDEEKLKAFANITFDDCLVVHGVKIIQGQKGYFVSMPSRRKEDGTYRDIAHPTNLEMRKRIEECLLKAYAAAFAQQLGTKSENKSGRDSIVRFKNEDNADIWPGQLRQSG